MIIPLTNGNICRSLAPKPLRFDFLLSEKPGLRLIESDASAGTCSLCDREFRVALIGPVEQNYVQLAAQFKVHALNEHQSEPLTFPVNDPE